VKNNIMPFFDRNFQDIFFSGIISVIGGIFAGAALAIYKDKIILIPGMLVLLPGFLELRGNISGTFASRLSSGLFLGIINPKKFNTRVIFGNLMASFFLVMIISVVLGVLATLFTYIILGEFTFKIIFLSIIAGILANAIEIPLTLITTFYLFRTGHDPNNIMGPFITTTGDITSILALLIAILII